MEYDYKLLNAIFGKKITPQRVLWFGPKTTEEMLFIENRNHSFLTFC
jgi:hypothetical protein